MRGTSITMVAVGAALFGAAPASAAVRIDESRVVVEGREGRAVIERAPFRMSFQDGSGRNVLQQVPNQVPVPQPSAGVIDPTNTALGPGTYVPLGFEVGGGKSFQHPGGLFTGNQLGGGTAGVVHAPTRVVGVSERGGSAELELGTTDPTRTIRLTVSPDLETGIRVRARVSNPEGVSSFADSFASGGDEAFHGFGGRHNAINQRGNAFYNWVEEETFGLGGLGPPQRSIPGDRDDKFLFPNGPTAAYYVQNLMVSSRPYGVLLNQTELTRWRMASDRPDAWQFVSSSASLDYTVAVGDGPTAVRTLTAINGRHRVPEEWAMGMALKRNVHQGNDSPATQQQKIRDDIAQMKRYRDLPVKGYAYESWDTLPAQFVLDTNRELKRMGIRPIGYVRAYVNDEGNFDPPGTFDEFVNGGYVVKNPAGQPYISVAVGPAAIIDFTNPNAVRFWERRKIRKMLDLGFDGFMQDFGEQVLDEMRFYNGETGATMHNKYPQIYHAATREILDRYEREHPERGKIWMYTRTGFSGRPGAAAIESANFPGDETSDYNRASGLPSLATDMLSRAVGGAYAYTTDIGGYFDSFARRDVDATILTRWAEWAALSPHFRLHNACCSTGTKMPWAFGEKTRLLYRKQALLHRQAIPYIRKQWRTAVASGMPPTRPMWLAFPGDRRAAEQDQQWMLGPDVLVAPVVEEDATARSVYFPRGCWESPETDQVFTGPRSARVEAPLGQLPYFFRCGTNPFAEAAGKRGCLARKAPIGPRNIGRVRVGRSRGGVLRGVRRVPPTRRTKSTYRWCVKRSRGKVIAVFRGRGKRARSRLVVTTARAHGNRNVRPGGRGRSLVRGYPRRRKVISGVYRAGPRSPRLIGYRRGRVRFIAVADRRLLRDRAALRRALRTAGVVPKPKRRARRR